MIHCNDVYRVLYNAVFISCLIFVVIPNLLKSFISFHSPSVAIFLKKVLITPNIFRIFYLIEHCVFMCFYSSLSLLFFMNMVGKVSDICAVFLSRFCSFVVLQFF